MSPYWKQTFSGLAFDLLNPRPEQVRLVDIAHQLAAENRYGGATRVPYSVAEHSVRASWMAEEAQLSKTLRLTALLHDAAEAYYADWLSPWKMLLRAVAPEVLLFEKRAEVVIGGVFGVCLCPLDPIVKQIDLRMLATERRDLMPPLTDDAAWFHSSGYDPQPPYDFKIVRPWSFSRARAEFLHRFGEVT